ncbi:MAG: efflux RND transporter periplasmic adaptor subunit [Alphaproteobacteria bacterium]|nr:efflux RND transporter periplasmic adaptor subunit [Alphaproteobacteria bacterium]
MKLFKITVAVLVLAMLLAGAAYMISGDPAAVSVVHPVRGKAVQAVYATGTVEPVVMLPVAPRAGARLVELLADEGLDVEKDTVLARLEDTDIKKELAEAQARVDLAQKEYDRKMALVNSGAISKQSIDQALSDLKTSQATLEKVAAMLDYMKLLSPEKGVVIRRDGEVGEFIPAGQAVFWVACCGYRVSAEVDEEDISMVQPGQKVLISADAYPGEIFEGAVQSITPKGDPVARSYRVRIGLDPKTKLMIGMTAETNIIAREKEGALLVPAGALRSGSLWVVRDGKAYKTTVKTGMKNAETVEVLEGVSEDDLIIKTPAQTLEEGGAIKPAVTKWTLKP